MTLKLIEKHLLDVLHTLNGTGLLKELGIWHVTRFISYNRLQILVDNKITEEPW